MSHGSRKCAVSHPHRRTMPSIFLTVLDTRISSLNVVANRHHTLPSHRPDLSEFISRFPNIKTLRIDWSYGRISTKRFLRSQNPAIELRYLEEVEIDLRQSRGLGDDSSAMCLILVHLGLVDVRRLTVKLMSRGSEPELREDHVLEMQETLRTALNSLRPEQFDLVFEWVLGDGDDEVDWTVGNLLTLRNPSDCA